MTGVWTRRSSIELTARAPGEIRTLTFQVRSLAHLSVVLPERSTRTRSRTWASALSRRCSATELRGPRDAYGIRTRTLHLDRVAHWPVVLRRHRSGAGTRTPITWLTAMGPAIRRHRNERRALPSCWYWHAASLRSGDGSCTRITWVMGPACFCYTTPRYR